MSSFLGVFSFVHWLSHPRRRREGLTVVSGMLIGGALVAEYGAGWMSLRSGLMVGAALTAGGNIAWRAVQSLWNRHVSIELLVTVAAAGAVVIGAYWEAAAVTFLFLLGATLEARTMRRTRRALKDLIDQAPSTALVVREGQQRSVPAREVHPGETVIVRPGATVPVDGTVLQGASAVDESPITGESMPAEKGEGDEVYAGSINQADLLRIRADSTGRDTTLAGIIQRVEEAQEAQAPTQRIIDRFAQWYTPAIIALSGGVGLLVGDTHLALTLLVIGCPGALVIATPVSVVSGLGRAARDGILIKGGVHLERAGRISALALDKTGTLTEGRPRVTDVIPVPEERDGAPEDQEGWSHRQQSILEWAARAEAGSDHPLALAIRAAVPGANGWDAPAQFESATGRGVRAVVAGQPVVVGRAEWMETQGIAVGEVTRDHLQDCREAGDTAVLVAVEGQVTGIVRFADTLRTTATTAVRRLKATGLDPIVILTGDHRRTAEALATEVGIEDVRAEQMPDDKLAVVEQLQQDGTVVAMAGDGINDAPALASADVGIAMGVAGTDVALETADIALMSDDLLKIPEAISLSRRTLTAIRQNVVIALATVAGLLGAVFYGAVGMAGGMLIHEASVLVVTVNGMRLLAPTDRPTG
ncbi:HAD family hydrolase [Salinibacter sp. 10B]|uniref:heavy metal translocating P-type ATPase n=1 Tax=Salinibacter sp. 10B TaxID=1923971 RepID=UPI000CF53650|nr:cation-translocating P-type ATPase [Salinibacter sp. 10B]PQJ33695.1 HAD family hydrolase [Salinibacter sp. 10B]